MAELTNHRTYNSFFRLTPWVLMVFIIPASARAGLVIDDFSQPVGGQSVFVNGAPTSMSNTIAASGVIGGTRTLYVDNLATGGTASVNVNDLFPAFNHGKLIFSEASGVIGFMAVTWDGDLVDGLSGNGFSPMDLTQGGVNTGILLAASADLAGVMGTIRIYHFDGTTNVTDNPFSDGSFMVPTPPPNTLANVFIPFASFSGSTNFTNVVAVQLLVQGVDSADLAFDFIQSSPNPNVVIPEPSSLLLWGFAGVGMAWGLFRRRGQRQPLCPALST